MSTTDPIDETHVQTAPVFAVAPAYKDPRTGALYVHADLLETQSAWQEEDHIGPIKATESFGDVESWCAYVERFGSLSAKPLLTWSSTGLRAVLDYHTVGYGPGRCQWLAFHPFFPSIQWRAWTGLANGRARSQKEAIEALEDLGADIVDPVAADLMQLLRTLRASVNTRAEATLREDGTTDVSFAKEQNVKSGSAGVVSTPAEIGILIPVLRGHVDDKGKQVLYKLAVRVRVNVDDAAHLTFRFSIPLAERVLEEVYADRVAAAQALLGDDLRLLRAAD